MLSLILGFLSSSLPNILNLFKDFSDKRQEIKLLELQMQYANQQALRQLDIAELQASAQVLAATQQTDAVNLSRTHTWVNDLNGVIRPMGALFAFWVIGVVVFGAITGDHQLATQILSVPLIADTVMFIIGYWYGNRSFSKSNVQQ